MRKLRKDIPAYAGSISTNVGTISYSTELVRCNDIVAKLVNDIWAVSPNVKVPI